jgi:hypothetical protein
MRIRGRNRLFPEPSIKGTPYATVISTGFQFPYLQRLSIEVEFKYAMVICLVVLVNPGFYLNHVAP